VREAPAGPATGRSRTATCTLARPQGGKVPSGDVAAVRRRRRNRERWAVRGVCVLAALGGAAADVAPAGGPVIDHVLAAVFPGSVAAAGSAARRWTWFPVAGAALALADGPVALACGAAALALALASTGPIRPAPTVGAAVGGLGAIALLRATQLGFHGSSALVTAAVAAPLLLSGYRFAGRRSRRRVRLVAAGLTVAAAGGVAAYGLAVAAARPAAERGMQRLEQGLDAARGGDEVAAAAHLGDAADAFAEAERNLGGWWAAPAKLLPALGPNARAADAMAGAAHAVADEAADTAAHADTDALTVQGGRLDLGQVRSYGRPLADISATLDAAARRVEGADGPWLIPPLADRLERVGQEIAAAEPDVELAALATRVLPAMFGGDGESRWFVAFVTPVEARGRTGFMGNYAELTATDGRVEMVRFGRAGELEAGGLPGPARTLSGPADYLARWGRFDPAATWRNVTMSPDFPSVGQVITELYPQSGGRPVDGVIAVDPAGLAALVSFTGPITVPGVAEPLTADNAARFLLRDQYLGLHDNAARVDALESLARGTFDRLTAIDLPGPRAVGDTLGDVVDAGHVHLYATDPDQQRLFERIGVDGGLPPVDGDALGIVHNNAVGNKIDLFLQRELAYEVTWDPESGALSAAATVTLTNQAPAAGLPEIVIGSPLRGPTAPPPGTNRTHLSVYSPWALDQAFVDGRPTGVERQTERDRHAYSLFLDIPPGAARTIRLDLSGRLENPDHYELAVSTQPLVSPETLDLSVTVAGTGRISADRPLALADRTATVSAALTAERTSYRLEVDR
jgi:hypothetical protein